ncbi:cysteine proteinase inhibitor A-like [Macadamia integrifolia]|uniref:cysteine proteinase inhibitor A-like n=1 Tax=Macadamia integrifolia TaxID=60698 RepID=UPI001C4F6773|nr:cysteine proteinase inhibitor A-like [Macadamia integrifolia]
MATTAGGIHEVKGFQNSVEIDELALYAVEEHNKKENKVVVFEKVVNAKEQVVAGTIYYLTLEVVEDGKKKIYEAKVWVKPWMNFKELLEFKPVGYSTA